MFEKVRKLCLTFLKSPNGRNLAILIILGILLTLFWRLPIVSLSSKQISTPDKRAELENAYRATFIQALGGIFFFISAYLTYANLKATEEKQITERFSKAIELLGNDQIEVRLGGIYALERISIDSQKDYWTIMEILTSFVRERSPLQKTEKITTDIQAALTVIGRRDSKKDPEKKRIDLRLANLSGADLTQANLSVADLREINLSGARLLETDLSKANLVKANLSGAGLMGANLSIANLIKADLRSADLEGANLKGAALVNANLSNATLCITNLEGASLKGADLEGANLADIAWNDFTSWTGIKNLDKTENCPDGLRDRADSSEQG